jgi:predicted Zn-dependent protease
LGDFAAAIEYMQPAADFGMEINHPLGPQLQAEIDSWKAQLAWQEGDTRSKEGDEAGAAAAYAQAVALAPDQPMLRRNYADSLIALGRLDEATAQLDAAEALDPDAPYLALRRAELAKARGDRAAAARWAEEALRRRPDWDEAQAVLAWAQG